MYVLLHLQCPQPVLLSLRLVSARYVPANTPFCKVIKEWLNVLSKNSYYRIGLRLVLLTSYIVMTRIIWQ